MSTAYQETFERDGYVVVPGLVPREETARLATRVEEILKNPDNDSYIPTTNVQHFFQSGGGLRMVKISQTCRTDPAFRALAHHESIVSVVEELVGADARLFRDVVVVKPAHTGGKLSFHQDSAYWDVQPMNLVSAWVALTDVPAESSPLSVIPGSHHALVQHSLILRDRVRVSQPVVDGLRRLVSLAGTGDNPQASGGSLPLWKAKRLVLANATRVAPVLGDLQDYRAVPETVDEARAVYLPVRAGDVVFFHSLLLHASGANRSANPRFAAIVSYMAPECQLVRGKGDFPRVREVATSSPRTGSWLPTGSRGHESPNAPAVRTEPGRCPICPDGTARSHLASGRDFEYGTVAEEFRVARCDGCGVWFLDPRPVDADVPRLYPEDYGPYRFDELPAIVRRGRDFVQARKVRLLETLAPPGARLLDIGCGGGALLRLVRDHNRHGFRLQGWDFPGPHIDLLARDGIDVISAPITFAHARPASADLIVLNQVIEHFGRPDEILELCATVLAPGGAILIETPDTDGWDARIFRARYWGGFHFPRHLVLFNEHTLRQLVESKGFAVESTSHLASPSFWIQSVHHLLSERPSLARLAPLFRVQNPLILAAATSIDLARAPFGPTSNLRLVARLRA